MYTIFKWPRFYTGQLLNKKIANGAGSLKVFDIEVWLLFISMLAFLFTFIVLFKLIPDRNLVKKSEMIANSLLEISYQLSRTSNLISLIIIFYSIYFRIYKSILTNNIKTNSVIVDTSDIIHSKEDLLNTKRYF